MNLRIPRDAWPTKGDVFAMVAVYAGFVFMVWAIALPHSWNT